MYIDEEGYLCFTKEEEYLDTSFADIEDMIETRTITKKYKVNKDGLFEEYIEGADVKEEVYTGIEVLGLEPRTLNALLNKDILSLRTLLEYDEEGLRKIKGIGNRAIKDIEDSIQYHKNSIKLD